MGPWSNRISVLIRGDTRELVFSLHLVETQQEGGQAHPEREVSPEASPTDTSLRLRENKFLLFEAPGYGILLQQPQLTKTPTNAANMLIPNPIHTTVHHPAF